MRWRFLRALLFVVGLVALFAAWDVHTPSRVPWERVDLAGGPAERADGLVVQHERGKDVYASRGWSIYRSHAGGDFEKVHTLVPRFGEAWAGFSALLRRHFGFQELVEVLPVGGDDLVVFGGGDVYRVDLRRGTQVRVHTLRYFGRGEGRGVMPHGIAVSADGTVWYGEYATRHGGPDYTIQVWRGDDGGRRWTAVYTFGPGEVRHVHVVQLDPVDGALWVGTGDTSGQSRLGRSMDGGARFHWIGRDSQDFRVCSLLFFPDRVVWGTDNDLGQNRLLRWQRTAAAVERTDVLLPSPTYYAQALGRDLGILATMENGATVYAVTSAGVPQPIVAWTLPPPRPERPHPGVRLPRSGPEPLEPSDTFLVNPLRVVETDAAIFRIPLARARTGSAAAAQ